ncbi:hypothetical protein CARUB_v10006181mg [Capsella rubella]|uniref:Uncharacterized protein n=1 Tax=Capsella rubella TaxID=81985 RepID=R0H2P9_9BRAS|nr:hypothetical protein CARUB_v10006181mg [Capsella rubella]
MHRVPYPPASPLLSQTNPHRITTPIILKAKCWLYSHTDTTLILRVRLSPLQSLNYNNLLYIVCT